MRHATRYFLWIFYMFNFKANIERYVILDDEKKANGSTSKGRFFHTSFYKGYTEKVDIIVRRYLKKQE